MGKRAKPKQLKRILAVSCSHGQHINKEAAAEVLRVRHSAEFSSVVHLGDFIDAQAFMSKNMATGEGEALLDDMREGIQFVRDLGPTCIFLGNHEDRLWRLRQDSNRELVRFAAGQLIDHIEYMARQLKAELVPYAGLSNPDSWRLYGGTAFGHGYLHNVSAARDHAETLGRPVVFGHIHKLVRQPGRTLSASEGISVGCLCDIPAMGYAKNRRETAAWENGYGIGEYSDDWCNIELVRIGSWQGAKIQQGQ
jgi:hypothetical protein